MAWRIAKSLDTLRNQVNAKYPGRNKASDGTIGDAKHSSRVSQHNPNPQGVVTAMDITQDTSKGLDGQTLADQLTKDSRVWYVIFNRRIWEAGQWKAYNGSNPHTNHVHVSTKQDEANYDNAGNWNLESAPHPAPEPAPAPKPKKEYVQLPKTVKTWATYPENGPYAKVKGKYIDIKPSKFGGLEYEVLGRKSGGDAVVIKTGDFGRRAIWVKGTSAKFVWK